MGVSDFPTQVFGVRRTTSGWAARAKRAAAPVASSTVTVSGITQVPTDLPVKGGADL